MVMMKWTQRQRKMIRQRLVEEKKKSTSDRARPKVIDWQGVQMIRHQSFIASVKEIIEFSREMDVVKIGIIGDMHSGKSTMAVAISHIIHKYSQAEFAVRIFHEYDLLNFEETLRKLEPANYILVFDDVSFLEASANKKQISLVKKAVTTIRHMDGGQDAKIILIYNYHYLLGLDKFLRQADFRYMTSVGSSELDNIEKMVGGKRMRIVEDFIKRRRGAIVKKYWTHGISPKESLRYLWRNPWIPVLFWNNDSLREIISPTREWIDPICSICSFADSDKDSEISLEQFKKETLTKFTESTFKMILKQKLKEQGIANTYSATYIQAQRYLDKALQKKVINLEQLAIVYGLKPTKTKMKKKLDGVLAE